MRIIVAGGTGTVGTRVTEVARQRGHEAIVLSRSTGVDVFDGTGLDQAMTAADAVIDVTSTNAVSAAASVRFFEGVTRSLLAAEERAGVDHHIALSIVGVDAVPGGYGYYQGKRAQERAVMSGSIPWTVLRATQFHEFARQMFERMKIGPFVLTPRMRTQPVAADAVAARLVELAEAGASGRVRDLAGPRVERMADLTRRYGRAAGISGTVVEVPLPGASGRQFRDGSLLPGTDAQLDAQTFTRWLIEQTGSDGHSRPSRGVGFGGIPVIRAPLPTPPEPSLSNARELIAGLSSAGMPITLTVDGAERALAPHIDDVAFRALQEAVSMVLTRTRGAEAAAIVRYLPAAVEIEVSHSPARLTEQASRAESLHRTRSDVRRLGGAVDSGPTPDGGFRLSATIPTPG